MAAVVSALALVAHPVEAAATTDDDIDNVVDAMSSLGIQARDELSGVRVVQRFGSSVIETSAGTVEIISPVAVAAQESRSGVTAAVDVSDTYAIASVVQPDGVQLNAVLFEPDAPSSFA